VLRSEVFLYSATYFNPNGAADGTSMPECNSAVGNHCLKLLTSGKNFVTTVEAFLAGLSWLLVRWLMPWAVCRNRRVATHVGLGFRSMPSPHGALPTRPTFGNQG
jgi:hypothetical protein